jgi:hypothetical protein
VVHEDKRESQHQALPYPCPGHWAESRTFIGRVVVQSLHVLITGQHRQYILRVRSFGPDIPEADRVHGIVGLGVGHADADDGAQPRLRRLGCDSCHVPRSEAI